MASVPSVVVMGVSGSGKSTIGELLADALQLPFVDGDALHPAANVEKMAAGIPLDDDDRGPWLDAIGDVLASGPVVVACSALKLAYRERLRAAAPGLAFVFLHGDPALLAERMGMRDAHFMPTSLLSSQLSTLEPPTREDRVVELDIALSPPEIVDGARTFLEEL